MKNLKTITGQELKVSSNKSKRTFTIRKNGSKYRTYKMSSEEFESNIWNTGQDWAEFLKTDNYYVVN